MSQEVPEAAPQQPIQIQSPVDLAKAVAGLALQEAVNLGEINPAMQRRFGERMEQLFKALVGGAGVRWGSEGEIIIVWPEFKNPILAAAQERKAAREAELASSTAIPETVSPNG